MNKQLCKLCNAINAILKDYFAGYLILDCYGTNKLCWTMKEAESWLAYCGKNVKIVETYDYRIIVQRIQGV
jgi:hypothetical protein